MCERCEGGPGLDRSIQVTDDTVGLMFHESTHVALQAASAYSNRWYGAAQGFVDDMADVWGGHGLVRMAFVWGAGWYFLPAPPGTDHTPGNAEMALLHQLVHGAEPLPHETASQVALADQIVAACKRVAEHASKGESVEIAKVMDAFDGDEFDKLLLILMAGCGMRLRHSRDTGNTQAGKLFMAHIHADLRGDPDDETEEGSGAH
ncbi:hypothetical protein ACFPC0_10755 [Streptomyces andamanensis]|uniref:Uncharacterized protein n=1 Tax=Streptomyces andamanensis TaxID=1565035 RepID=A0ABV8TCG4_9ACTN